jgi:hypothetical protein
VFLCFLFLCALLNTEQGMLIEVCYFPTSLNNDDDNADVKRAVYVIAVDVAVVCFRSNALSADSQ